MEETLIWQAWCDGCARPNPGYIGLGALLISPDGSRHPFSLRSPHQGCNTEAEARALLAALQHARSLGARQLRVHCDSDVVVRLALNEDAREAARLHPLFAEIRGVAKDFEALELRWLPHQRNHAADQLARAALSLPPRAPPKPPRRRRK